MNENKHTKEDLKAMQSLPWQRKVLITQTRIMEWYQHFDGKVYVSFSGGKDSTVLLHIARQIYPDIEAVFVDTGLEYPEIREFVKTWDNVTILRPKMRFDEVIKRYGWNFPSKDVAECIFYAKRGSKWAINKLNGLNKDGTPSRFKERYKKWKYLLDAPFEVSAKCCKIMKEKPLEEYEKIKKPIIGTMANESQRRKDSWLKSGCNAFQSKKQTSQPMSFWTEQDILQYILHYNLLISSVYGDIVDGKFTGEQRTGCMFCPVGCHLDKQNKYQRMKITHPKQYDYCMRPVEENGLGLAKALDYIGVKHDYEAVIK